MRRLGRWIALGLLATSLTGGVAAPASAGPPSCEVRTWTSQDAVVLRAGKPWDLRIDCGWWAEDHVLTPVSGPAHGTVQPASWDADLHEWRVTYEPAPGYTGTDAVTFSVTHESETAQVVVSIVVEPNRSPSCHEPDGVHDHVVEDGVWTLTLDCTDLDLQDQGALEALVPAEPSHGDLDVAATPTMDGLDELTVTYTPDPGFEGSDTFAAGVGDGELTDAVDFFLNVSDGPWCAPSEPAEVRAGQSAWIHPSCSQPSREMVTMTVPTPPSQGSVAFRRMAISYTADPEAAGVDSFTFQATGADGTSNVVTQEVTILPNAAPACEDASAATPTGSPVAVALTCTDPDGDDHELTIADQPRHGTLGELADGSVTYTPDPGWDGTDSFTYTARDFARTSAPATVSVAVTEEMEPVVDVAVVSQAPSRVARRGLRLVVDPDEPVTARVAVGISSRLANRLDIPRRIGRLRGVEVDERRRVTVELTRRASLAIRSRDRLPVVVDLVARDEWGNATSVETRGVLR